MKLFLLISLSRYSNDEGRYAVVGYVPWTHGLDRYLHHKHEEKGGFIKSIKIIIILLTPVLV